MRKLAPLLCLTVSLSAFAFESHGLIGKKPDKPPKNLSAIACTTERNFPRSGIVVDDETRFAQKVVVSEQGLQGGDLIPLPFAGTDHELDAEGAAFADGFYYVIGSHGHPRHASEDIPARIHACSLLYRFSENGADVKISTRLRDTLIDAHPELSASKDKPLQEHGLCVEGLAAFHKRLYVGFRGPAQDGKALLLSASPDAFFGDEKESRIHVLNVAPGQGIRDLTPYQNGILVLLGPEQETQPGDRFEVGWWNGSGENLQMLGEIPHPDLKKNPEAILPLQANAGKLSLLVLLDGARDGEPFTAEVDDP